MFLTYWSSEISFYDVFLTSWSAAVLVYNMYSKCKSSYMLFYEVFLSVAVQEHHLTICSNIVESRSVSLRPVFYIRDFINVILLRVLDLGVQKCDVMTCV